MRRSLNYKVYAVLSIIGFGLLGSSLLFTAYLVYALLFKKVYAAGRWFYCCETPAAYWVAVIGIVVMIGFIFACATLYLPGIFG